MSINWQRYFAKEREVRMLVGSQEVAMRIMAAHPSGLPLSPALGARLLLRALKSIDEREPFDVNAHRAAIAAVI